MLWYTRINYGKFLNGPWNLSPFSNTSMHFTSGKEFPHEKELEGFRGILYQLCLVVLSTQP